MKKFWAILMTIILSCWAIPAMALEPAEQSDDTSPDAVAAAQVDAAADDAAVPAANGEVAGQADEAAAPTEAEAPANEAPAAEAPAADEPAAEAAEGEAQGVDGLETESAVEPEADEAPTNSHTITFTSEKYTDQFKVYTLTVPEDKTVWEAINALDGGQAKFFSDINQEITEKDSKGKSTTYGVETYCTDKECKNAVDYQTDFAKKLTGNLTYYAKWDECITEVTLTVTPPTCGTAVNTKWTGTYWDFTTQKEHPVIALPSKAKYELLLDGYISGVGEEGPIALNEVTLEGGVPYKLFANLQASKGYLFSKNVKITVDGAEYKSKDLGSNWVQIQAEVTAVHNWGDWKQTKAPTCVEPGEEERACTAKGCKATETQEIPIDPDAHEWGEWKQTKAPTCSSKGEEERVCKLDSEHVEKRDVAIDPDAHEWGDWKVTKKATATTEGEKERVCKLNSEHVEKEKIAKTGSSSSSSSKSSSTPKTGDSLIGIVGIVVALAAASGIGIVVALRRRRQQ